MTTPDDNIDDFLAELNADFGPKKKDHKALNRKFHLDNPQIGKASGKAPERLNPENSSHWQAVRRETHIVRQFCKTCNDSVEFIHGEYVRFKSIMPYGGYVLRNSAQCAEHFLFYKVFELEDAVEYFLQEVPRCAGCIKVEQQAAEIWSTAVEQHLKKQPTLPEIKDDLEIDL